MSNRWLARCIPVLDRIFPALVNLRTLQIKFHGLLWRNIAGIRSSFLSASKLPDLHQVTISGIYSVPSLDTLFTLFEGSNIADIRLMNVTTGGSLKDSPRTRTHHVPGSVAPIPLETLSLSLENKELWRLSSWLADPSCVLHLSGLRKLRLNIVVAQEMKAVCRLLKTLQIPSLEAIEIQLETFDYVSDPEDIPDLSRFRHVRLTVTPEYVSGSGMYELDVEIASFVAFCWSQMLSGFRENAIESVALLLPKAAQRVRCTALDAALTRADMSHLRRVYLEDETATEYRDEVIKDILPNLYEKGLLG
ncbi:uncharacterized protein BT62DRAFT_915574 [Guyanagaster necrorhizus]|uniref:Uncharacterized protein n=1 Tax=Guyanagaster necrorhizus TaxID=856835 RepID=A0A9P7W360_9AGAR|nr:uncharacterized protein BT62DRAFT_915574 [Guyanagaster necrorhizus MCA 3950]KAG7451719.1 hypothetical protein BT62DRAFT_915574 [Guyanagaster necrorhizus MCA 3950]